MNRKLTIAVTLLALALMVWAFYLLAEVATRGGDASPVYSTRRHDPYGTAAIYDLLRQRGIPVRTLERSRLESTDHGVLVQVLSDDDNVETGGSSLRPDELINWMTEGNTVIQFSRQTTSLMKQAGAPPAVNADSFGPFQSAAAHEIHGLPPDRHPGFLVTVGWNSEHQTQPDTNAAKDSSDDGWASPPSRMISLRSPMLLVPVTDSRWRTLAGTRQGTYAGELRVGRGKLIIIGAPTPILNHSLLENDNLEVVLSLIGSGPVIMDEWSHGIGHGGTIMEMLRRIGLLPVLLQLVFVIALYTWSTRGHRPQEIDDPPRLRSSVEQIETLGHLYSQSLKTEAAHTLVTQAVRKRMAKALRCRPADVEKRAAQLPPALAAQAQEISDALRQTERESAPLCKQCGYDLTGNTSGTCPECRTPIPMRTRQRIASEPLPQPGKKRSETKHHRYDVQLSRILTLSSEFVREATRVRTHQR